MKLIVVIPCYNEELVLHETVKQLSIVFNRIKTKKFADECEILFVDDGSKDNTWSIIEALCRQKAFIHGLKLAHNVGHQNALWAGLEYVAEKCDFAVSVDADLQDDINCMLEMLEFSKKGCDVVYGVRRERKTDTIFKRSTAQGFYKFMHLMGVDLVYNHADYRLMSQRAIKALLSYPERNLFLRGIVPLIGFQTACVYYDRAERFAGESKYPLSKMLNFAIDGITSFSVKPLRLISAIGFFVVLIAVAFCIWALIEHFGGNTIQGWTSILLSIWLVAGVQLLCVGVLGEYVGKIYKEVKRRPRYLIEENI